MKVEQMTNENLAAMQKTVQVVIEIDEEHYKRIMRCKELDLLLGKLEKMIANGTVLPRHGRLGDLDAIEDEFGTEDSDIYAKEIIRNAPTILEAWGNEE